MRSVEFTRSRALASCTAQTSIASVWLWNQKTVVQWNADITALEQLIGDEDTKYIQWRSAADAWEAELIQIQQITRDFKAAAAYVYRNNPLKLAHIEALRTDGESRAEIYSQGVAAKDAWQETDPNYDVNEQTTLDALSTHLQSSRTRETAHSTALSAWRKAAVALNAKAQVLDQDNVAWYDAATRRFPAGTEQGELIRSTVPTTTRATTPVGQAQIVNLIVGNGDIHFDVSAQGATRFTVLHQSPSSLSFVVLLADSPQTSINLHGQAPGVHRFKAFGSTSSSQGPESEVAMVTVPTAAAA
jgi:hypothetical protein